MTNDLYFLIFREMAWITSYKLLKYAKCENGERSRVTETGLSAERLFFCSSRSGHSYPVTSHTVLPSRYVFPCTYLPAYLGPIRRLVLHIYVYVYLYNIINRFSTNLTIISCFYYQHYQARILSDETLRREETRIARSHILFRVCMNPQFP